MIYKCIAASGSYETERGWGHEEAYIAMTSKSMNPKKSHKSHLNLMSCSEPKCEQNKIQNPNQTATTPKKKTFSMGFQQQLTWYYIYTNFVHCVFREFVQQYSRVNTKLVLNHAMSTAEMLQNVSMLC